MAAVPSSLVTRPELEQGDEGTNCDHYVRRRLQSTVQVLTSPYPDCYRFSSALEQNADHGVLPRSQRVT